MMWGAFFAVSSALSSVVLIAVFIAPYPERINWLFCLGVWALTVFCFFKFREEFEKEKEEQERHVASRINAENNAPSTCSQWEQGLYDYVRNQLGCSTARANDRSVIVASDGHTPLEIDIFIPDLRFGIEADGIRWHDREAYLRDQRNGTEYSEEMYKERYCARRGIKLIHVWDEDGKAEIQRQIAIAIREQRNKLDVW